MSIVKMHNKKTGVTYVYESESYWDKEKQQPRNRRKLIGKIDPETGEIVPTGRPGRRPAVKDRTAAAEEPVRVADPDYSMLLETLEEKNAEIARLKDRVKELEFRSSRDREFMDRVRSMYDSYLDGRD